VFNASPVLLRGVERARRTYKQVRQGLQSNICSPCFRMFNYVPTFCSHLFDEMGFSATIDLTNEEVASPNFKAKLFLITRNGRRPAVTFDHLFSFVFYFMAFSWWLSPRQSS